MAIKKIIERLRVILGYNLRQINSSILVSRILHSKNQVLKVNKKSALVVSPHQDDETLGCGGTIALKRAEGVPVRVVFITDGRYGRPEWIKPEEIIKVRQQEAVKALSFLGVEPTEINFLDRIDGTLQNLPNEQRQHIIARLVKLIKSFMPEEIYVTHRKDSHEDHEATYDLVQAAIAQSGIQVELLQYPIWMFWQSPLSSEKKVKNIASAYRVPIDSVQDKKRQAIETYKSQLPGLTSGFLRRFFLPYEIFFKN